MSLVSSPSNKSFSVSFSPTVDVLYFAPVSENLPRQDVALQAASSLVTSGKWKNATPTASPLLSACRKNFVYAFAPPQISGHRSNKLNGMKSWGDMSINESEEASTYFQSTDFMSCLYSDLDLWEPPDSNDHQLHPTMDKVPQLPPDLLLPPELYIKASPYSRSSIFIPVSGQPPFRGSSSARFVPYWPPPRRIACEEETLTVITWTPYSLDRFWGYLLSVRVQSKCGPIGVSYQPSYHEATGRQVGKDWAYIKVYLPTILVKYMMAAMRKIPGPSKEGKRDILGRATFGWVDNDSTIGVG